ncbi:MAG: GFA family protein [Pseudomonadota bacterium]
MTDPNPTALDTRPVTGACRCGAIRFSTGPARDASYCHCSDCRKATAAPVSVFVEVDPATLRIEGEPAAYRTPDVTRSFCGACGTPLAYADERLEGRLWLMLGALHEPERFTPARHAFTGEALPWFHVADDLPRLTDFSVPRPE